MKFLNNGKVMFDDVYELNYHLFMEMGLSINNNGYLYDQDNGTTLMFKDKYIKATTIPVEIYAGKTDIVFNPAENFTLMNTLFCYYLDKYTSDEELSSEIKYIAHFIEDNPEKTMQRIAIRTANGDIFTSYYYNLYLGFIEAIFILSNNFSVDLSNFDIVIQKK